MNSPQPWLGQPALPSGLQPRLALLQRLNSALTRLGAVLICCPAGYGKTSLALQLLDQYRQTSHWLSLDPRHDQPEAFSRALAQALQQPAPAVESGGQLDLTHQLSLMLCQLDSRPRLLVIDNCHYLQSNQLQQALLLLVQYRPSALQILLLSRHEPTIGLPRLQLEQQLAMLSERDLRFSTDEAQQLLGAKADRAWLDLCDGWAAALRLVSLSRDLDGLLPQRHLLHDYLATEILLNQPPALQQLMLMTSVANQFNAELAELLMASPSAPALALLQAQHLLQPADGRGEWLSYPRLLQDFLQQRCRQSPKLWQQSHRLCLQFWRSQGQAVLALQHGLQQDSAPLLTQLLKQDGIALLEQGNSLLLEQALAKLSPEQLRAEPELCRLKAEVQLAQHSPCKLLEELASFLPWPDELSGQLAAIQAEIALAHEDLIECQQIIEQNACALQQDAPSQSRCQYLLSQCALMQNQYLPAQQHANLQLHAAQQTGVMRLSLNAWTQLAQIALLQGNLANCQQQIHIAENQLLARQMQHSSLVLPLRLTQLQYHWLRGEIELTDSLISEAKGLLKNLPEKEQLPWLTLELKLALAQQRQADIQPLAQRLTQIRYASLHPRRQALQADALLAELALNYPRFQPHPQNQPVSDSAKLSQDLPYHYELLLLIQALECWFKDAAQAVLLLQQRLQLSQSSAQPLAELDSLLFLIRLQGETSSEGKQYWRQARQHPLFHLVPGLIASHRLQVVTTEKFNPAPQLPALVSNLGLTIREWQVLQAIGQGLSNDEICSQLCIGLSTLKTHINRLYHKLGIEKREQARFHALQLFQQIKFGL